MNVLQDVAEIPEKEGSRLSVIHQLLEQRQKILQRYDEDILNVCNVENIAKEKEESDEIISKIIECLTKMTEKICIKPQSVAAMDDVITVGASSSSTSPIQPIEIQKPNLSKLQMEKFNPIRPSLFSRSPGPGGAQRPGCQKSKLISTN